MAQFLSVIFWALGQVIGCLNTLVLSDGTFSAGFFNLMIGFVVLSLLLHNIIISR